MPAPDEATGSSGPDRLSAIVFSGTFEKVHYALALAASAAALGKPATLFFTMGAIRTLVAPPGGNGDPGWRALPTEGGGGLGGGVDDDYRRRGIATFEELLQGCVEMGVRFLVCEMGLRAVGLERSQLRADIPIEEGGLATFLTDASAMGAMVFI